MTNTFEIALGVFIALIAFGSMVHMLEKAIEKLEKDLKEDE